MIADYEARKPGRPESPREQKAPPWDTRAKGVRLFMWEQNAEAQHVDQRRFTSKAQERKKHIVRYVGSRKRRKALKGKAQECW
jgi:hypothetical protein